MDRYLNYYHIDLIKVIDGDSIVADVKLFDEIYLNSTNIRLKDVYAPEIKTSDLYVKERGLAARDKLIRLITDKELILFSKGREKYGRLLGIIYAKTSESWSNINDLLNGNNSSYFLEKPITGGQESLNI